MTFARLRAADWYSTQSGEEARRIQEQARPQEGERYGQVQREVEQDAGVLAEAEERNAW